MKLDNDKQTKLTDQQKQEIIRREKNFAEGKTIARSWSEIKVELENKYK
ncbi:MAG: hypothetical protein JWQ34_1259 [Mucilaginibacter sp.]|nr:addiction module protein [Mucilaginibacter sp.]MDB5003034.1 hypothetical protein [Mucilaginibacter sp.]